MTEYIIGPFTQLLPMCNLPSKGAIPDNHLEVLTGAAIHIKDGIIKTVDAFERLTKELNYLPVKELETNFIGLPGFIDCHTHICFAGSRARDFAWRIAGKTYLEIAKDGGGIWDTVTSTRAADPKDLLIDLEIRANLLLKRGITTIEVKSGYGLDVENELKMLRVIKKANERLNADLISTCLAAHIVPREFKDRPKEYLQLVINELLPQIRSENLASRIDAFIEEEAYTAENITPYLEAAKNMGMDITLHADQFSPGGSELGIRSGAVSVDHLEASGHNEIEMLAKSDVVSVVLPGASIGLGCDFAPSRAILDAGGTVAIASDWNPGSAPMGDLFTQASIMATFQKMSNAEVFSGLTSRAAKALNLTDRGTIESQKLADIILFEESDYRELLYRQGRLMPKVIVKKGKIIE